MATRVKNYPKKDMKKGEYFMLDFFEIKTKNSRNGLTVYPKFKLGGSVKDLMVQGKDFYAIWDEQLGLWSRNEYDVQRLIDTEIDKYISESNIKDGLQALYLWDYDSGMWKKYKDYIKNIPPNYHQLDTKIVFANDKVKKSDYISRKLPYVLEEGDISAYDELMSVLYAPEERKKLEWAIGAIISGDSKKIQKFIAITGEPGKGKGTFLNLLQSMFDGYVSVFNAKDLANGNNAFAGDAFANNPLIAIQTDGNLSKIQDNTLLNSIVAHEKIIINEKFKSKYEIKLNSFLFMATNDKIDITNYNSGIKRRLIDVNPTNETVDSDRYDELIEEIETEKGAIAYHCLKVYESMGKNAYKYYEAKREMARSNIMYNFIEMELLLDPLLEKEGYITLKRAYNMYKLYCEDSGLKSYMSQMTFKDEFKHYFREFKERALLPNGQRERNVYYGLKLEEFNYTFVVDTKPVDNKKLPKWLDLKEQPSEFDKLCKSCPAQLSSNEKTPDYRWDNVETKLSDLDTHKLHYIRPGSNIIMIDFDLAKGKGKDERTIEDIFEVAKEFPPTYAELSKGGGLHLHYIYDGNIEELNSKYNNDRRNEIKVYPADKKSAIRRKLTKCNNLKIAHMEPGFLPLKENKKKVIKDGIVKNETILRILVTKALNREIKDTESTTQCIHFIHMILDEAYNDGYYYDLSDLEQAVFQFASKSTHQAEHCLDLFDEMHFKSKNADLLTTQDVGIPVGNYKPIVFFDIEVFPNLFVLCYAFEEGDAVVMENPGPEELENLFNNYRLVGFNNKDYDNIVVYKRWKMKLDNLHTYYISKDIVQNGNKAGKTAAKFISYTDIYDYLPTMKRQSLKEFEIDLDIHHEELGLPWDKPVDEKLWPQVEKYCCYDVEATRALWFATQPEFKAREILAELTGMTVNDSTNELSQQLIFGDEQHPQIDFNYRFMGECEPGHTCKMEDDGVTCVQDDGKIIFPGYKFDGFNSSYLDVDKVGEGGYIFYEPGMYDDAWTFDVSGQHPASIIAEKLFGDEYTAVFADIVKLRTLIKHKDFESAKKMFDGKVAKYLDNPDDAKALSNALKVVVNSVYGMTFSIHDFRCKDDRNIDNIVAKRGSLFMINLRYLVQKMGYTVIHCKTDSIKVQHPDKKIYDFIMDYGKRFGYNFEIEHKFEKICLVNKAVYIAKLTEDDPEWVEACEKAKKDNKPMPTRWTATGTQFAVPYVFKTLFSKEPLSFKDFCEKKKVQGVIYKDMNEELEDVTLFERIKKTRGKIDRDVKVTNKARAEAEEYSYLSEEELDAEIAKGHNYMFVGKVGNFVPIKPGCNGGILYRYDDKKDTYAAVTGTDGWRWQEAEIIQKTGREQDVDESYHQELADKAVEAISKYGDFEWFVS